MKHIITLLMVLATVLVVGGCGTNTYENEIKERMVQVTKKGYMVGVQCGMELYSYEKCENLFEEFLREYSNQDRPNPTTQNEGTL